VFVNLNLSQHDMYAVDPMFSFTKDSPFITLNAIPV